MDNNSRRAGWKLVLYAFLPSSIGILVYFLIGLMITGIHLLLISLNGQAYPASFNDAVLQWYSNTVIQPLATIFNSSSFNDSLTILLWGVVGLVVYELVAYVGQSISNVRDAEKDITTPQEGMVVRHPLERSTFIRLAWRLFISILLIIFTVGIQPLIRLCLTNDNLILSATHLSAGLNKALANTIIWIVIFHAYAVLFRFYVLRVRVFGNFILE